jgi:murein DD-endopeptidase MepM/ murein hydrolase activator NlpD
MARERPLSIPHPDSARRDNGGIGRSPRFAAYGLILGGGIAMALATVLEIPAFGNSGDRTARLFALPDPDAPVSAVGATDDLAERQEPPEEAASEDRSITVRRGDTLMKALMRAGASADDSYAAIEALRTLFDPRRLRAGQTIVATFDTDTAAGGEFLAGVSLPLDVEREIAALRAPDGAFMPHETIRELDLAPVHAAGTIDGSLYESASDSGVPARTIMDLIRIFSWDVDFQRGIQPGDRFDVLFDAYHAPDGSRVKEGDVTFASLTLSGTELKLYRYETSDGEIDYFDEKGRSARKALMKTPVDGAKLSSRYGSRKHPILGYTMMHRGIDFAAPRGTPVMAAGDGVVEQAGPNGAYGNYVRLRHNGTYKTAYAHLQGYGPGIRSGRRVRQGDVIGFIGSTGRSTGPHLHYEVLRADRQVNPLGLKLPTGLQLSGAELKRFHAFRQTVDLARAGTPERTQVASNARSTAE